VERGEGSNTRKRGWVARHVIARGGKGACERRAQEQASGGALLAEGAGHALPAACPPPQTAGPPSPRENTQRGGRQGRSTWEKRGTHARPAGRVGGGPEPCRAASMSCVQCTCRRQRARGKSQGVAAPVPGVLDGKRGGARPKNGGGAVEYLLGGGGRDYARPIRGGVGCLAGVCARHLRPPDVLGSRVGVVRGG
jgi:hypothetical protein